MKLSWILFFSWLSFFPVVASSAAERCVAAQTCAEVLSKSASFDPAKKTVLIVDGYSSGKLLPLAFKKMGVQVVHLHSFGKPPKIEYARTFVPENFDMDISHRGDVDQTVAALSEFTDIVGVVVGADSGVLFGDQLTTALKKKFPEIRSNGIDPARKDKYLQHERLAENGVDSAKGLRTKSAEEALNWLRSTKLLQTGSKKVMVKPLMGAGMESIFECETEAEVEIAVHKLVGTATKAGILNQEVLVQEYLPGDEYVVNTTSLDGHHVVTEVWKYVRRLSTNGKTWIYDYDLLLPHSGEAQEVLEAYAHKVLNALGIKNGNGHAEIKLVPGRGPVLVEMNNRLMGSGLPELAEVATGHSQVDRTVLALLKPEEFKKLSSDYKLRKNVATISLANFTAGAKLTAEADEKLKAVPGYYKHSFGFGQDEALKATEDLGTSYGSVWIVDEDPEVIAKGIEAVHKLEKDGSLVRSP